MDTTQADIIQENYDSIIQYADENWQDMDDSCWELFAEALAYELGMYR